MKYEVVLAERAERQLHEAADWIAKAAPLAADRWFNGFIDALLSLGNNPERCNFAHESPQFPYPLRQFLYRRRSTYRALFTIRGNQVVVLTIRHAAQRDVTPEDLIS